MFSTSSRAKLPLLRKRRGDRAHDHRRTRVVLVADVRHQARPHLRAHARARPRSARAPRRREGSRRLRSARGRPLRQHVRSPTARSRRRGAAGGGRASAARATPLARRRYVAARARARGSTSCTSGPSRTGTERCGGGATWGRRYAAALTETPSRQASASGRAEDGRARLVPRPHCGVGALDLDDLVTSARNADRRDGEKLRLTSSDRIV